MRSADLSLVTIVILFMAGNLFFPEGSVSLNLAYRVAAIVVVLNAMRAWPRWQMMPVYATGSMLVAAWVLALRVHPAWLENLLLVSGILLALISLLLGYLLPLFRLPDLSGQYTVGRRELELGLSNGEKLPLMLWFPSSSSLQTKHLSYHAHPAKALRGIMGMPGFVFSHLKLVKTHARSVVTPSALEAKRHPLIVYSHGAMGASVDNTALVEELVSHGYCVLGIDHKFSFEKYGIDRKSARQLDVAVQTQLIRDLVEKAVPTQAGHHAMALDELRAEEEFQGLIDWDKCAALGHSLGGTTAVQAALGGLYSAVVNMDGPVPDPAVKELTAPLLYLSSFSPDLSDEQLKAKRVKPEFYRAVKRYELGNVSDLFKDNRPDRHWFRFHEAGHLDFTDIPFMVPLLKSQGYPKLNGHIAKSDLILNFFNHYLKGLPLGVEPSCPLYEKRSPVQN